MLITESRLTVEGNGRSVTGMQTHAPSRSTPSETLASRAPSSTVHEGLQGIVATETRLSRVEGDVGRLTIAGYDVGDIAPRVPFEAMAFLLLHDRLPAEAELG